MRTDSNIISPFATKTVYKGYTITTYNNKLWKIYKGILTFVLCRSLEEAKNKIDEFGQ